MTDIYKSGSLFYRGTTYPLIMICKVWMGEGENEYNFITFGPLDRENSPHVGNSSTLDYIKSILTHYQYIGNIIELDLESFINEKIL